MPKLVLKKLEEIQIELRPDGDDLDLYAGNELIAFFDAEKKVFTLFSADFKQLGYQIEVG